MIVNTTKVNHSIQYQLFTYTIGFVIIWIVFWSIFHSIFGVYLGSITVNNGILFNNIVINLYGVKISLKSLVIRGWGRIRINEISIFVTQEIITKETAKRHEEQDVVKEQKEQKLQLRVLPHNKLTRYIIRFLIRRIPDMEIECKDVAYYDRYVTTNIASLNIGWKSSICKSPFQSLKSKINMDSNELRINYNNAPILSLDSLNVETCFTINLSKGVLNAVAIKIYNDNLKIFTFQLVKSFIKPIDHHFDRETKTKTTNSNLMDTWRKCTVLYNSIDDVDIFIEDTHILDIPFIVGNSKDSFEQYLNTPSPATFLDIDIKGITLNVNKLPETSAGFFTLFELSSDLPVRCLYSIQSLRIYYNNEADHRKLEVINIPNYSINITSNLFHTLSKGQGKKSVMELFLTCSNPIIDMDSVLALSILYNITLIKKFFKYKKVYGIHKKLSRPEFENIPDSGNSMSTTRELLDYINQYHPNLDVKFVIEHPKLIIRHCSNNPLRLISCQFDFLMIKVATLDESYDLTYQMAHPLLKYIEKTDHSVINHDTINIRNFNVILKVSNDLSVKLTIELMMFYVDLSKFEVVVGINELLTEVTDLLHSNINSGYTNIYLDSMIQRYSKVIANRGVNLTKDSGILEFSNWLIDVNLRLENIKLRIGSRSILIPQEIQRHGDGDFNANDILKSMCIGMEEFEWNLLIPKLMKRDTSWSTMKLHNLELTILDSKTYKVIQMPSISMESGHQHDSVFVKTMIGNLKANIDSFKVFVIIGSIYLVSHKFHDPLHSIVRKARRINEANKSQTAKANDWLKQIMVEVRIKKTDLVFTFHENYKLKIDGFQTNLGYSNSGIKLHNKFMRVLTLSPTLQNHWTRLLCVDDIRIITDSSKSEVIVINTDFVKFIHPHKHVTYKLFDNMSVTIKIIKHLIKIVSDKTQNTLVVHPSESMNYASNVRFKAKQLMFYMEDDPFESELNMIYQLGKTEQLKRLHYLKVYELYDSQDSQNLTQLQTSLASSWIRKVKAYKQQLNDELVKNKKFVFGHEAKLESRFQGDVQPCGVFSPLLSIIMENVDLNLSPPKFKELNQYLYDMGQGVPKDTKYSFGFASYIELQLGELRMHLRDYPIPIIDIPSDDGKAARISGHLVLAEALVMGTQHLRRLKCQLVPVNPQPYDCLEIEKTLGSIKLYHNINIDFMSALPCRFVWGHSYQFGIQQVMLNLDQFSKPPLDPSPKLGFWDKLRLLMHGKLNLRCRNNGPLEVAFKGSTDPYDIFNAGAGFILSFEDDVVWTINENDDSENFCNVTSHKVNFYIPNYSLVPLLSWIHPRPLSTYLPASKQFITSGFGYYLNLLETVANDKSRIRDIVAKQVVRLSGGVKFKVGFILETLQECKHHYEVELYNPEFTSNGHDSYQGFRSDSIKMMIGLDANYNQSYNSIHFSPAVFGHFFKWWKLFDGNMQLPIRRGKLFKQPRNNCKFSQYLVSNRFLFNLSSLFLSHICRIDDDDVECYGLRGKANKLIVDLHQRKEERISINERLSTNAKVKKMNFHLGDVYLDGIDLRVVAAKFKSFSNGSSDDETSFNVFDNDNQWFDIEDYQDAFMPSISKHQKHVTMLPLLYTKSFLYHRETYSKDTNVPEVTDILHQGFQTRRGVIDTRIKYLQRNGSDTDGRIDVLRAEKRSLEAEEKSFNQTADLQYHNKFVLLHMLLKWNNDNRNLALKYLHCLKNETLLLRYASFESLSILQELIAKLEGSEDRSYHHQKPPVHSDSLESCQERLDKFDDVLNAVKNDEKLTHDYLVEIISPQIQLQSQENDESIIILSTPKVNAKIVSVYENYDRLVVDIDELENRYGVVLEHTNAFVFRKHQKIDNNVFDEFCYGSTTKWPPWLGVEVCIDGSLAGKEQLIIEDISGMINYVQQKPAKSLINEVHSEQSTLEKLTVDIPQIIISSTSSQYYTLYLIIMDLLIYTEPSNKVYLQKLEKLKFSIDFEDMSSLYQHIKTLVGYKRLLEYMGRNYSFRQQPDDDDYLHLKALQHELNNEINLLMRSIFLKPYDKSNLAKAEWIINTDKVILHMLEDDRSAILDIVMNKGTFRRAVNEDDSNINQVEIFMIKGINLLENSRFLTFLEPLGHMTDQGNLITVDWSMFRDVGGIKVLDNFEIKTKPLSLRMDQITGKTLIKYILQVDLDQDKEQKDTEIIDNENEIDAMIERSKKYISINYLKMNPAVLLTSLKFKGGYKRLLNVTEFKLLLPELVIEKEILSVLELTMILKKLVIRAIMSHAGGLLKNKMTISRIEDTLKRN